MAEPGESVTRTASTTPPTRVPPPSSGGGGGRPRRYREVTIASLVFGIVVGTIMNAAITYAGLKIGFTIVGSSIAAVLGFGVLRGMLRKGSILEINIGQTIASAVNTPCSGVIFTVPVLFLIGIPLVGASGNPNENFWLLTLACVAGAILGCAFIIPLRKQMIDIERLRFPSATAVGAILKSPGAGAKKSIILVIGVVIAALLNAPAVLPQIRFEADVAELDDLLRREKIGYVDKLRTEMLDGWMRAQAAPEEVVEHGRVLAALGTARGEERVLSEDDSDEAKAARATAQARVAALEAEEAAAARAAYAVVREQSKSGAFFVGEYKDELALRAWSATTGEIAPDARRPWTWESLRSRKVDWATAPMWGYSDLNLRTSPEADDSGMEVDYAFDGLGTPNEVLTRDSDRDRNGRADLLVTDDKINVGRIFGLPPQMELIFAIAPFALGAGYLTGRAGLYVLAGGVLAYLILTPTIYQLGWMPESIDAYAAPGYGFLNINRPLGIGLLLGGAMMGVFFSLPAIKEALKSMGIGGKKSGDSDELGLKMLTVAALAAGVFLFLAADFAAKKAINPDDPVSGQQLTEVHDTLDHIGYAVGFESAETMATFQNEWTDAQRKAYYDSIRANRPGLLHRMGLGQHARSAIIALIGAIWIWFAGIIIAQCTGMTDWSPISGMALITIVLVLVLAGVGDVIGGVLIGAALCVAITCASDMMADLKTGYIVGGSPKRQQIVELLTVGIGPVISMFVLLIIVQANMAKFGIEIGPGTDTVAPQAQALQAVITGVQGGDMPYALYAAGAMLGALLGLGSFAGLGVLVGLSMYLPMYYIATYGVGCVINILVGKVKGRTWAEEWGVPVAAGFIVGDALLALSVNLIVLGQAS